MTLLLGALRVFWPYILGAIVLFGAYSWAHHRGVMEEKVHTDAAVAALDAYVNRQRLYAAQLVLDYQAATDRAIKAEGERDAARKQLFTGLADAARRLPRGPAVAPAYVRVLNSAAANSVAASPAPPSAGEDAAPASTVGDLTEWGVQAAEQYRACTDQVAGLQAFYNELRASGQNSQVGH